MTTSKNENKILEIQICPMNRWIALGVLLITTFVIPLLGVVLTILGLLTTIGLVLYFFLKTNKVRLDIIFGFIIVCLLPLVNLIYFLAQINLKFRDISPVSSMILLFSIFLFYIAVLIYDIKKIHSK